MGSFLHHFFHNETNDSTERSSVQVPKNENDWPEEWRAIDYKQYVLFRPITLPTVESNFFSLLVRRRTSGNIILENKVGLRDLAHILRCGYGLQYLNSDGERKENRTVPSAGKRYPLELYPVLFKDIDGCKAGIYHYGVREHVLEPVTFDTVTPEELKRYVYHEWLTGTAGVICISAVFNRVTKKYGSRGYRYALLEAGHIAQNMALAGAENNLSIVPVGGINEVDFERRIGLTNSNERIIYAIFF